MRLYDFEGVLAAARQFYQNLRRQEQKNGDGAATPVASEGDDFFFIALPSRLRGR
jgi:hypothetical protein